ncbi:lipoxygenase homology domain-containing protein 1, partial [Clonorchis sinensis]
MPKYTSMYSEEFPYPQKFLDDDPHDYATLNPKHDASYKMVRPAVKTAYFYQDGDIDARGIRIAIHPNRYRSLEALLGKPAQPVMNSSYTTAWGTNQLRQAKRIYVRLRGDQKNQKTVVIRRRYVKNIEQIETIDDLIKGPNEIIATGNERYSPKFVFNDNVITPIARSRSEQRLRSHGTPGKVYHVDKSRHRSVGRPSSTAGNFQSFIMFTEEVVVLQSGSWKILITSGVVDADTGDTYLAACTSNILLTVCDRYHGSQPIVLRSAYVKTLPEPHVEVRHEKGNCPNGTPPAIPENVPFNPGRTDRFDAVLTSVRDIYKIRLSHDGTGSYPEWFPKEVRMQPLGADHVLPTPAPSVDEKRHSRLVKPPADSIRGVQPELVFPCNKWLSRVKGEGSLTVEVAAPGTQLLNGRSTVGSNARILTVDPLSLAAFGDRAPAIRYEIHVTTGNLWDAGTKAQISVQLQGDRGDSGRRVLYTPGVDQSMNFIRGQTSVFGIDAVFLGRLRRMTVWIEAGERTNTTWYLERIVVREILLPFSPSQRRISDRTSQSLHEAQSSIHSVQLGVSCFPCHQWLGLTPKPGTPEIQLTATAGSGAVAADMLERSVSSNQEETWWQLEQWKFRPGNAVVFYSYATGARMRVVEGGRIEAHQLEEKNTVDTSGTGNANRISMMYSTVMNEFEEKCFDRCLLGFEPAINGLITRVRYSRSANRVGMLKRIDGYSDGLLITGVTRVTKQCRSDGYLRERFVSELLFGHINFTVGALLEFSRYIVMGLQSHERAQGTNGCLASKQTGLSERKKSIGDVHRDVERFNESNTVNKIRQFCCAQDAWLRLSLNPTAGLYVT